MTDDTRKLLAAQGIRALAYGFGAVLLGDTLAAEGLSHTAVGLLLTAVVAGMALASIAVGMVGDRVGRRRVYALLFIGLAASGLAFALTTQFWLLCLVALTGTLSTGVSENGPFTTLEQAMLPAGLDRRATARMFGTYNAVAAVAGSLGALAAGVPVLLQRVVRSVPLDHRLFIVFVPIALGGALIALTLSDRVEVARPHRRVRGTLPRSRRVVVRLAGLFAVDSVAGGFVLQTFIAYWLQQRFGASLGGLGAIFFVLGLLQAASFVVATRLAERFGLLTTMVFSHLPSNVLLVAVAFAPSLPSAIAILSARFLLSQMDVPTRQAYLVALVDPGEVTAAAAFTNSARNAVRPIGPALAGVSQQLWLGAPFVVAGTVKSLYDLALWSWFRHVPITEATASPGNPVVEGGPGAAAVVAGERQ